MVIGLEKSEICLCSGQFVVLSSCLACLLQMSGIQTLSILSRGTSN